MDDLEPIATLVIPAHNEERVLPRLLDAVFAEAHAGEFEVFVICNGCTDRTADVARGFGDRVEVIEIPEASKALALDVGGARIGVFPVVFIDADVRIDTASLRLLVRRLKRGDVLATGPERDLVMAGVSWAARSYYRVWQRLPQVTSGLFGRGVIAISEPGYRRVADLPGYTADDVAFAESFGDKEKAITAGAAVSIWPARTWRSLLKRRVRAIQGMLQLRAESEMVMPRQTSMPDLLSIVRVDPRRCVDAVVFLWTTLIARLLERRARRAGNAGWMRDETSRV